MNGKHFWSLAFSIAGSALLTATALAEPSRPASSQRQPNILLITVDDMNWNSPGCFGSQAADITPNIDRLATEGLRFANAHVTVSVCTPSRSVLLTGMYPHRNGVEGFQRVRPDVPTLPAVLAAHGYLCGTLGKWLGQQEVFRWDVHDYPDEFTERKLGRQPQVFYQFVREVISKAKVEGRPFFIMANSHDPHRPFYGSRQYHRIFGTELPEPSRIYKSGEINVPAFLPDLPDVRTELAQYYSSVRRADDTVGAIMKALHESGADADTLVIFLSDNGMAFPFAKSNCYLHSTRTPWIVRWPGRVRPGSVDENHLISGVDFMATALEAAGVSPPRPLDGQSILPLLRGEKQGSRDLVFTQYHHIHAGKTVYPMRCVQSKRYGYIFNPWSDGERVYDAEPLSDLSFPAMQQAAADNPDIRSRVRFLQHRCVEEFYDFERGPDALHNLVADPQYAAPLDEMRRKLADWMTRMGDPALEAFLHRDSPAELEKFMRDYSAKADAEVEALKEYEQRTGYRF